MDKKKELTPKQVRALSVLSLGQSQVQAAKEAKVNQNTLTVWMKDEKFRDELRLLMERMRQQFESRVMIAANDGMAVIQKAMRNKDEDLKLRAANSAVNAGVRIATRYKELQVEGYVAPLAPMIVFADGQADPIFNPTKIPAHSLGPGVIDTTAEEIDGDGGDSDT
jgi:hypothetical protein